MPMRRATAFSLLSLLVLSASPAAASTAYTYDSAGRLIQATVTQGSTVTTVQYIYDAAGNRVQIKSCSGSGPCP